MSEIPEKAEHQQQARRAVILGYSLLALGLAIVGLAVILALGFLGGYVPPPTPYPVAVQAGPSGEIATAFDHVANVLFMSGLLVAVIFGGSVISGRGLQFIQATKTEPWGHPA